jgi:uncharacterized repeat protein (TIGR01451 family)
MVITAQVAPNAAGASVENTAVASADEPIARPALLTSEASIAPRATPPKPVAEADLAIAKKANHKTVRPGEAVSYTITVTNHGPASATNPTVTDTFSKSVKLVSAHVQGGTCSHHTPVVCHLPSIATEHSTKIEVVAKPTATGKLHNAAVVTSPTPDPNVHNDVARATVDVRPGKASLSIRKTASRRTVEPGEAISFTITVRSLGPSAALDVKVCDRLGSGMTLLSARGAAFHHGNPCWNTPSLANGKQRRYVLRVRVPI